MEMTGLQNIALGIIICLAVYNGVLFFTTARHSFLFAALMAFSFSALQGLLTFPLERFRGAGVQLELALHLSLLILSVLFMSSLVHFTLSYFQLPGNRLYLYFYAALVFILLLFTLYNFTASNALRVLININIFSFLVQLVFTALGAVLIYFIVKRGQTGSFNSQVVFFSLLLIMILLVTGLFFFSGQALNQVTFNPVYYSIPFLLISLALVTDRKALKAVDVRSQPVKTSAKPQAPAGNKKNGAPVAGVIRAGNKKAGTAERKEVQKSAIVNLSSLVEGEVARFNDYTAPEGRCIIGNIKKELYVDGNADDLTRVMAILLELVKDGENRGILLNLLPKQETVELTIGRMSTGSVDYKQKIAQIAGLLGPMQAKIFFGKNKYTRQNLSLRLQFKRFFKDPLLSGDRKDSPGNKSGSGIFILTNPDRVSPLFEELHLKYNVDYSTNKEDGTERILSLKEYPELIIVGLKNEIDAHDFCYEISNETGPIHQVPILLLVPGKPYYFEELKRSRSCAFEYVTKPLSTEKLNAVVDRMVGEEKMRRERVVGALQEKLKEAPSISSSYGQQFEKRCVLMGLNEEEIKISRFLAEGLDIEEIILQAAMPEASVQKLTESIYEKCAVSGRIDFINLMAR